MKGYGKNSGKGGKKGGGKGKGQTMEPAKPISSYSQIGTSTGAIPQPVQIE
jgi:hypothetical protein